jgi:hypothetical protein
VAVPSCLAFTARLCAVAVRRDIVMNGPEIRVPVVVAGDDVIDGIGTGLATDPADLPIAAEDSGPGAGPMRR